MSFQFFPSCCRVNHSAASRQRFERLSILSQLLRGEVAVLLNERQNLWSDGVFQFFPSCCLLQVYQMRIINGYSALSILSQLLPQPCRGGGKEILESFQFFPSCCL